MHTCMRPWPYLAHRAVLALLDLRSPAQVCQASEHILAHMQPACGLGQTALQAQPHTAALGSYQRLV